VSRSVDGGAYRGIGLALIVVFLAGTFVASADSFEDGTMAQRLFRIERSKNANIVVYDARIKTDGRLDDREPVVAYWLKLAEDGGYEKLSRLERRFAYGFKTQFADDNTLVLNMSAKIEREITVDIRDGRSRALVDIDGRRSVLGKVYVESIERKLWPRVEFLELYGSDVATGEETYERIYP